MTNPDDEQKPAEDQPDPASKTDHPKKLAGGLPAPEAAENPLASLSAQPPTRPPAEGIRWIEDPQPDPIKASPASSIPEVINVPQTPKRLQTPRQPPRSEPVPSYAPTSVKPRLEISFAMPNATCGKPYDATVELTLRSASDLPRHVGVRDISILSRRIEGLDQVGLKFDVAGTGIRIHGTPAEAGDHPIIVDFTVQLGGKFWINDKKTFFLTINPDPRSLWKEIEPDPSSPYARPHTASARVVGESVMVAASRRGRSHANKGDHRDDDFRIEYLAESGWYLMAVADGAGSAPFSRRGAELACASVCKEIQPHLSATLGQPLTTRLEHYQQTRRDEDRKPIQASLYESLGNAALSAYKQIVAEAGEAGRPPTEFATTLLFTIAKKYPFGWFVATFAVGDGGICIYSRTRGVRILNRPDSGDFAGQTRFLTMPQIWSSYEEISKRIDFAVVSDFDAIISMTDGVSDPKFSSETALFKDENWHAFWDELSIATTLSKSNAACDAELLEWLNFWAIGNHDDRTITILLP